MSSYFFFLTPPPYPSPLPLPKAGTDSPLCRLYFSHKIKDFAGALFHFTSSGQMN